MFNGIVALIPAAGYSSRMGDFKPLLKLGAFTAAERVVRCFRLAGIRDVRVVTGHRAPEVVQVLKPRPVQRKGNTPPAVGTQLPAECSQLRVFPAIIHNAGYALGMYSSVQEGVKSLEPGVRAFFMAPVDTPLVRPDTLQRILARFAGRGKPGIIYPVYRGRRGHPTLISTRYAEQILSHTQPGGLREFLSRHEGEAAEVEVNDEAVLLDMDTPQDYQTILQYLEHQAVPSPRECRRILSAATDQVRAHCLAVARVAATLADRLNKCGAGLDKDLVTAGAMLHDVARGRPDHAAAGARLVERLGYRRVARVVASHMNITACGAAALSEAELVFLADKLVKGCQVVYLAERFNSTLEKLSNNPRATEALKNRWQQAELIKTKAEKILGRPLKTALR
ncbi:MAG: NTP transferase domain-containing protein [Firmicutes bacterium]|nr:NTP transferase domain-containing protein [Bacillota bacterium]